MKEGVKKNSTFPTLSCPRLKHAVSLPSCSAWATAALPNAAAAAGNNNIDGCQGESLSFIYPLAFLPAHYGIWIYLSVFRSTNGKEYLKGYSTPKRGFSCPFFARNPIPILPFSSHLRETDSSLLPYQAFKT